MEAVKYVDYALRLLHGVAPDGQQSIGGLPEAKSNARAWLQNAALRDRLVKPHLPDGAWRILIDLFCNDGRRRISVSSACIAAGMPSTTALRWIGQLVSHGLITKIADEEDGRRIFVELTPRGMHLVQTLFPDP